MDDLFGRSVDSTLYDCAAQGWQFVGGKRRISLFGLIVQTPAVVEEGELVEPGIFCVKTFFDGTAVEQGGLHKGAE